MKSNWHIRIRVLQTVPFTLILGCFALAGAAAIAFYTYQVHGGNFFGWDAPYYIAKTKVLLEEGLPALLRSYGGVRIGYTLLSGLIAVATPLTFVDVERYLPYFCVALIAFANGWLVMQMLQRRVYAAIAVVVSLSYFGLVDLSLRNNSDNLFAFALFGLLVNCVAAYLRRKLSAIAALGTVITLLCIIGITHLETLALAGILYVFVLIFFGLALRRQLRTWLLLMRPLIIAGVIATVAVLILWGSRLSQFTSAVSVHAGSSTVNQAAQYQLPISVRSVLFSLEQPYTLVWALPLIMAGSILLGRRIRKGDPLSILTLALVSSFVVAYCVFWLAQFDYNFYIRIVSLLPVGVIVALGVAEARKRGVAVQTALLTIALVGFTSMNIQHIRASKTYAPEGIIEQVQAAARYVDREWPQDEALVISSSTTRHDTGEFATFTMWQNWIVAALPKDFGRSVMLHFGNPQDLERCVTTQPLRETQTEYTGVSAQSITVICKPNTPPKRYIVLQAISRPYYNALHTEGEEIAPGVLVLTSQP